MNELKQNTTHSIQSRTRTFTWEDPMIGAKKAMTMDGLDYLRSIVDEEIPLPPISNLMNIKGVSANPGETIFEVTPEEYHYNPIGMVHGGLMATLMDSAMGCAVQTKLPAGTGYSTVDLQVTYIKSANKNTGVLTCIGRVLHLGGKIATTYADVRDSGGNLYAHATSTCIILRPGK